MANLWPTPIASFGQVIVKLELSPKSRVTREKLVGLAKVTSSRHASA